MKSLPHRRSSFPRRLECSQSHPLKRMMGISLSATTSQDKRFKSAPRGNCIPNTALLLRVLFCGALLWMEECMTTGTNHIILTSLEISRTTSAIF
ncbi:hypothetical protein IscW_ISCW013420 [Ixodes scapularis]|uniref:Uncharacterized protein n=1 Tax=Ixodes scapularis TaxID=6945 RepID=B7QDC8_IXOSC|nr:hypothetical protein IscW_ISCW013420 [Ixodes scapularis]|eukprot:XP_002413542.1 hypothetical protein IscW_ISCW013420 [Ixodes scapularis]